LRLYSDNNLQLRYFKRERGFFRSAAISIVGDIGYEHRGNAPSGAMGGILLTHRWEWTAQWKSCFRSRPAD
jgi:hypothetical protein